jgi:hypothetical protein
MPTLGFGFRLKCRGLSIPFQVADGERGAAIPLRAAKLGFRCCSKFVISAVKSDDAVKLHGGGALRGDFSFDVVGPEDHPKSWRSPKHLCTFCVIAGIVAALSGGGVDDDFAGGCTCRAVDDKDAPLYAEGAGRRCAD